MLILVGLVTIVFHLKDVISIIMKFLFGLPVPLVFTKKKYPRILVRPFVWKIMLYKQQYFSLKIYFEIP